MAAKTYYYARVSSTSQNLSRQIEAFKQDGADEHDIITEKKSGKDLDRPEYQAMKYHMLREGDTLVVMSLDRLGRNKNDIKGELEYYRSHNIRVRILDIPTTNFKPAEGQEWILDMVNNILVEVLASQAEQERLTIRKRQAEGIAIAKAAGKYKGGQPKQIDEEKLSELYKAYMTRKISKSKMAMELGVSRPTMDKILERRHLKD
ncbi:recombinase family protein [Butyrivibrio sp. XPD2002]|uniref:recombinase family protein n=1 Tax=Butyrivibrio sp. XPD2002 TaxID=1280665 RepID=UPI000560A334|nr:recombinase family protein [Butyrivibrio sp. XPD2002]